MADSALAQQNPWRIDSESRYLGERAVVLGASMAGLLAASVLSDFFRTVTVIERDELPDDPVNRRGVPQGRHVRALLARGAQILDEFFPGFLDELVAAGAPVWDDGNYPRCTCPTAATSCRGRER